MAPSLVALLPRCEGSGRIAAMKAVVCHQSELTVREVADPRPERGQLLLEVRRCGICGSDLHARHHAEELRAAA